MLEKSYNSLFCPPCIFIFQSILGKSHEGKFIVVSECDQFIEIDGEKWQSDTTLKPSPENALRDTKTKLYKHPDDEEILFRWDNFSINLKNLLKSHAFEYCKTN